MPLWGFFSRVSITEPFLSTSVKRTRTYWIILAKRYHLSNIFFKRVRQSPLNRVKCLTKRLIKWTDTKAVQKITDSHGGVRMTVCSTDCNDDRETFRQSFFRMDNPASFACVWLFCHVRSVLQWLGEKWTCRCHCNHNERCLPNRRACCTGSKIRWVFLKTYSSGNEWLLGRGKSCVPTRVFFYLSPLNWR